MATKTSTASTASTAAKKTPRATRKTPKPQAESAPVRQTRPRKPSVAKAVAKAIEASPVGKAGASKDHDHGEGHEDAGVDGHIWLDPVNARKLVAHLQGVLGRRYPDLADRLAANAGALTARLDELESQLAERMRPLAGRSFIVFHDAYQYFEARFGLTAAGAITVNPEVPPGAKRISQLRARIKEAGARCVFAEPQFRAKVIDSIAEGTAARSAVIDPIGADVAAGSEHYFKMMGNLAASFEACLADPS